MLALTLPAGAATRYHLRVTTSGGTHDFSAATVTIDGQRVHLQVDDLADQPLLYDSAVSLDGGRTWIAMNSTLQTHFKMGGSPLTLHSRQLSPAIPEEAGATIRIARQRWEVEADKGVARLSYVTHADMMGNRATARHAATIEMIGDGSIDAAHWPAVRLFTIGIPALDGIVGDGMPSDAFPSRITAKFSRRYEGGGTEFTETVVIDVENVQSGIDVTDSLFMVPSGWRDQPPVIGVPGLG